MLAAWGPPPSGAVCICQSCSLCFARTRRIIGELKTFDFTSIGISMKRLRSSSAVLNKSLFWQKV